MRNVFAGHWCDIGKVYFTGYTRGVESIFRYMPVIMLAFTFSIEISAKPDRVKATTNRLEKMNYRSTDVQQIPALIASGEMTRDQIPNPHWRVDGCVVCHSESIPGTEVEMDLRSALRACADCHGSDEQHVSIHPLEVAPDPKIKENMPPKFAKSLEYSEGKLNCLSCHDIVTQCKVGPFYKQEYFPAFLRGSPYRTRTDFCYNCHVSEHYVPLTSHDQISDSGKLNEKKCLLCHRGIPQQFDDGPATRTELIVDHDWKSICINCHPAVLHPSGNAIFNSGEIPNHLVSPPSAVLDQMQRMSEAREIILPLDPTNGRIYCATCHNPHEKGVIKDVRAAKGADEKNRLRAEGICEYCHDK